MQLYEMLENENRQILSWVEEFENVEQDNMLERNIRFERLREGVLHLYEARNRTFYTALLRYPESYGMVDHVQHLQVQVLGLIDALLREPMGTEEWEGLSVTLSEWLHKVIALEHNEVTALAKCYLTAEDEAHIMADIGLETHVLYRNDRNEEKAEKGFNDEYKAYKTAPDTPGKSHLPPKRWRLG